MQKDLFDNIIKDVSTWNRLSENEKAEILKKSEEKKKAEREKMAKRNYDIDTGRQKSILYAWDDP